MDISRRRSNDEDGSCTASSMYLSFDAESTMSTACYKTLEAMTDVSSMSALSIIDDHDDKHMNSTLENKLESQLLSPLKTVKKVDIMTTSSPLRALPKNIMRGYKALSSTPSREQLMKTVDVTRGSDASRFIDLGVAFLGVEDEQPAFFPLLLPQESRRDDNKENTIPESIDGSTLSVSSSVETATSLIEKRFNSVSTTGSLTGDESEAAISVIEKQLLNSVSTTGSQMSEGSIDEVKSVEIINEDEIIAEQNLDTTPKAKIVVKMMNVEMEESTDVLAKDTIDCTPKAKFEGAGRIGTIAEDVESPIEMNSKALMLNKQKNMKHTANVSGKSKIVVLTSRSLRRSICEPNLQTNKPSRISMSGNKRQSLLPVTNKKTTASADAENEIPYLMNKILKITNSSQNEIDTGTTDKKDVGKVAKSQRPETIPVTKSLQPIEKRRSLMPHTKGRTSLMPSTVGEKRPFSFTHRMSVVVKTTLNSPARKIARKSIFSATNSLTSLQRRSMMATKSTQTMRMNKIDRSVRKSMIPNIKTNSRLTTNPLASIKETDKAQQTNSMFPLAKLAEETKLITTPAVSSKVEPCFTCNVCKEIFRVKSLLDAHKHSHEGDIVPPTIKKPTATTAPNGGSFQSNSNQCKYCDKRFALVRALHIHLLQNCSKIPPSEKRKLEYTEMNHVEKARLPSVFHHANGTSSNVGSTQATQRKFVKQSAPIQIPKMKTEFVKEKDLKKNTSDLPVNKAEGSLSNVNTTLAAASSNQKPKKTSAHSGVYRTPSKTVPCHVCKLTFKSILDYTNHSLATHGNKTQQQDTNLNGDVVK